MERIPVTERTEATPRPEDGKQRDEEKDTTPVGSSSGQAKVREREMEESGEENAA